MHSYDAEKVTFAYNGDFSGDIIIANAKDGKVCPFEIPAKDILDFVAYCYLQSTLISKLEDMDAEGILKLFQKKKGE